MTTAVSRIFRADLPGQAPEGPQRNFARVWRVSDERVNLLGDKAYALHIDHVVHMYAAETRVGQGGAAGVFLSTNTEGQTSALKKTIIKPGPGNQTLLNVNRELRILAEVRDREDPADMAPSFAVFYEGADGNTRALYDGPLRDGDLFHLMRHRAKAVRPDALVDFFRQIAPILVRNHERRIINADLKLANLLYTDGKIYLHDYGNAAGLYDDDKVESLPYIAAPELLRGEPLTAADPLAPKVDIYDVGLAALGLLYLFIEEDRREIDWTKVQQVIGDLPVGLQQIMNGLLDNDPRTRWSAAELQDFVEQMPSVPAKRLPWDPRGPNEWRNAVAQALSEELELYSEQWQENPAPLPAPLKRSRAIREDALTGASRTQQAQPQRRATHDRRLDVALDQGEVEPTRKHSWLPSVIGLLVGVTFIASGTVGAVILATGLVMAIAIGAAALVGLTAGFVTRYALRALGS